MVLVTWSHFEKFYRRPYFCNEHSNSECSLRSQNDLKIKPLWRNFGNIITYISIIDIFMYIIIIYTIITYISIIYI